MNQSCVLGVEFDQANGRETFYDRDRQALLTVTFNPDGLPQSWVPANGGQPVNITYDRCEHFEIIYSIAVTVYEYMHSTNAFQMCTSEIFLVNIELTVS